MPAQTAPAGGREPTAAVLPLPAFTDNYIWAIVRGGQAAVVDPAKPAGAALPGAAGPDAARHSTHAPSWRPRRRRDGVIPNAGLTVYGPARERLPRCDVPLTEGDRVTLPELDLDLRVLDVPGHTAGHIAYRDGLRE